jgi:Fur family transcriptional regulator, ferric uptake regulator
MGASAQKTTELRMSEILRRRNLSVTDSRKKILSIFLAHHDALAHGDIEKKAGEKFDRVTVYRTLQTFVEKGILHTIPTPDNSVLYALCKDCDEGHHHDDHVHFHLHQLHKDLLPRWRCFAPPRTAGRLQGRIGAGVDQRGMPGVLREIIDTG